MIERSGVAGRSVAENGRTTPANAATTSFIASFADVSPDALRTLIPGEVLV
ncbi:MAG TPA: hypothetical protein VFT98_10800 [Myxococcota bacterium]|nr:hypothetical protein [Myxococcota bacterium]